MSNSTIAVTGASRGLGAAIALELATRGFTVGCLARNGRIPDIEGASALSGRFIPLVCDVTDESAIANSFSELARSTGGIDGLVNNAGIYIGGASRSFPTPDFEQVLRVNAVSVFAACREVYPYLRQRNGGIIVNIGSFFAEMGAKGHAAYSASKAAIGAITRCLAAEWGSHGISVLNVAPGYIETDMNRDYVGSPEGAARIRERTFTRRVGRPDEVARMVAAIFTEKIGFLTGSTLTIDGGHGISL